MQELHQVGILEVCCATLPGEHAGKVRCLPQGIGGQFHIDWPGFFNWLDTFLWSSLVQRKRKKLAATKAFERHCFIGLSATVPWAALRALGEEFRDLPPTPPVLPSEITHLWLWGAEFP